MSALNSATQQARFDLQLTSFPNQESLQGACRLIYRSSDPKLIASLNFTPYHVGRSFSREEQESLAEELQQLNVGFVFRARPPFNEEIRFQPKDQSTTSEEETLPLGSRFSLKFSRKQLGLLLSLSLACLLVVWWGWNFSTPPTMPSSSQTGASDGSFDAKINSLEGRVEHRRQRSLQWESSQIGLPLVNRDSLRTLSEGSAEIEYRQGQKLTVSENTLIVIGETRSTPDQVLQHDVEVEEGRLLAALQPSEQSQRLRLITSQGVIQLDSPPLGQATSNIVETHLEAGELTLSVVQGQAQFSPVGETESILIEEASELKSHSGGRPQIRRRLEIPAQWPPHDHRFSTEEVLRFAWQNQAGVESWQIRFATDSEMQQGLLSQRTRENQIQLNFLDPGKLYWQVVGETPDRIYQTPVHSIYVP